MVETEEFKAIREDIRTSARNKDRFVIAIDGRDGSGKSSLARYLGWTLGIAVVEMDLFMKSVYPLSHRVEHIDAVVNARRISDRAIIVEGLQILQILDAVDVGPDFLILMERIDRPYSLNVDEQFSEYQITYGELLANANHHIKWSTSGLR